MEPEGGLTGTIRAATTGVMSAFNCTQRSIVPSVQPGF